MNLPTLFALKLSRIKEKILVTKVGLQLQFFFLYEYCQKEFLVQK
jgi:hypothetical protein